ncbi:hypothetical protein THAOC_10042 [Thalassiosira oceanica]|uniref:Uncharacterized protein n=1 Tax=Thalassiosira oceanica TaxID=159749 RepID=K0T641_THAOC|nr:hypothetical protein THAOC_10042 [Thalassiosira oceanica]|mmetsp:Transcript_29090/g.69277  ORF Transcript_29090/g.69277 Transcript_29090/m.69277 type:complete len:168 (-) Transcript_29090:226-729(-)|eukprot:EJK68756.1 hypothetical protein THAOC_10042 [Thalassiosira oceanica]
MMKAALLLAYFFLLLAADGQETRETPEAAEGPVSELESSEDDYEPKITVTLKNGLDFKLDVVQVFDFDEEEEDWMEWEEVFENVEPGVNVEILDPEEGDQFLVLESGTDDYLKLIEIEELKNETIIIDESTIDDFDDGIELSEEMLDAMEKMKEMRDGGDDRGEDEL